MIYYTTQGGCPVVDSVTMFVSSRVDVSIDSLVLPFCGTASPLKATANLSGGTWKGSGTWGWNSGMTVSNDSILSFDPNGQASGIDSIFYMISSDCGDTAKLIVGISPMETAQIDSVSLHCNDWSPVQFTVDGTSTPGGNWSGTGINASGLFDPSIASDTNKIYYTTPGVCFVVDSVTMFVSPRVDVSIDSLVLPFCGTASPLEATANLSGGTWKGSGTWGWNSGMTVSNDSILSFDPNGQTPGIDSIFYMISSDCGDTATLIVGISPMEIANIDTVFAVCADLPAFQYNLDASSTQGGTWRGNGISASGIFDPSTVLPGEHEIIYKTPGVCWVEDTIHITVLSVVNLSLTGTQTFCGNALPKNILANQSGGVWFGNWTAALTYLDDSTQIFDPSLVMPGTDSVLYGIAGQCGDTASLVIGISPMEIADIDTNNAGPFCSSDSPAQLLLNPLSTPGGIWSGGSWINTIGVFDPNLGTVSSNNEVIYTTQGVCASADTFNVTVVGQIIVDVVDAPVVVCNNGSNIDLVSLLEPLTSSTNGPWQVSPSTPGLILGSDFVVTSATPGDYTVKYALYGGTATCADSDSVVISVLPVLDPSIQAGPSGNTCISDLTYQFTNTGDPGGTWTISGSGVIDGTTGSVNLSSSGVGSFTVTYTFGGTCSVSDQTTIDIKGPGDPTIQPDGPFCENLGLQQLLATGTQGGTWSGVGVDPLTGSFNPTSSGPGTHTITYDLSGACPISGTTDIVVEAVPVMDVLVDNATGCEPLTVTFLDNSTSKSSTSVWSFSDGSSSALTDSVTMTFVNSGCYNVFLKNEFINGCVDSISVSNIVCVNPVPTANFDWGPKNTTVLEPFIDFDDKSIDATSWTWNFDRGTSPIASTAQNPFVKFLSPDSGVYNVCLIAANGICADTICKDVTILDNFSVYVPNAFTPDGDGLNDVFFPNGKNHDNIEGAGKYEFMIFNRWGELIWESTKPYQPWDGTKQTSSNDVQEDVYVWKLNVWDNVGGVLKTYYGHVSVLR